jgi:hypothetical protein
MRCNGGLRHGITLILGGHRKGLDAELIVAHVDVIASRDFDLKSSMCVKNTGCLFMDLAIKAEYLRVAGLAIGPQE